MTPTTDRKTALTARLADLTARLHGIDEALREGHTQDWEDLATEREGEEVLEGIGQAGLQEIRQIEHALARIDAGDYGICAKCGGEIAEARLDVLPWTPLCAACAA